MSESEDKPIGPPVDVDRLLEQAASLPFEAGEDTQTQALEAQLAQAREAAGLEALVERLQEAARASAPLPGRAHALIPCGRCGRLERVRLADPPRAVACGGCGAEIDPAAPFDCPLAALERVLRETEVTVLVVLAARTAALWALSGAMRHALAGGHGMFVVARVDLEADPQAPRVLGIARGPALAIYQGGRRLGVFVLPQIAGIAAGAFARWFGPWISGAPQRGLGGMAPLFPAPEGADRAAGADGEARGA